MITSSEFINLIKEKKYDEIKKLANEDSVAFQNLYDDIGVRLYLTNCSDNAIFNLLVDCKYSFTESTYKEPLFMTICRNNNIDFKTFENILNSIPDEKKQAMFKAMPDKKDEITEYPLNTLIRAGIHLPETTENYEEQQKCFVEKIKLLIKHGANIKAIDNVKTKNTTACTLLFMYPHMDVDYIKSLIERDNKILKTIGANKKNILHECASFAKLEIIELLINNNVDIFAENIDKTTPLMLLCKNKNVTVEFLGEIFKKYPKIKRKIKTKDKNGKNALHYAADGCNIEIMDFLANVGIDTTTLISDGTPLIILVKNIAQKKIQLTSDFMESFNKLFKNKNIQKSINIVDTDKQNVLHEALKKNSDMSIIKILIKNGANIKQENTQGVTPFMLLCKRNDIDAKYLEELINKNNITKKDINRIDDFGNSILSTIVRNINKDKKNILKLLIDRGADINIKNKDGKTVLDIAQENNDVDLLEFLKSLNNKKNNIKSLQNNNKNTNTVNTSDNSHNIDNNTILTNNKLPDLKLTTEKVATSYISEVQITKNTESNKKQNNNNKTQVVNDMKNNTKQETVKQNTQTEHNRIQNNNDIQNNNEQTVENKTQNQHLMENKKEENNITETKTTGNDVQVNKQNLQNTPPAKKDINNNNIMFMFCLMLTIINNNRNRGGYFGNSIMFR